MRRALAICIGIFGVVMAAFRPAIADDLRCYKVKDPQAKVKYVADIEGITAEPGCTIQVPATTVCVPGTTTHIAPPLPGSPLPTFKGLACYKTKCPRQKPKQVPSNVRVDDRFGDRSVKPSASQLLCVPVDTPIFSCGGGPYPQCGGTCPDGQVCLGLSILDGQGLMCTGSASCGCVDAATACANKPCPSRLCDLWSCPSLKNECRDCKRPGGVCAADEDCCFGSCSKVDRNDPTGTCVDD